MSNFYPIYQPLLKWIGYPHNDFVDLFYRAYEIVYTPTILTVKAGRSEYKVNPYLHDIIKEAENKARYIANNHITYKDLYDFSTFVKIVEKVCFYMNDDSAKIACDSRFQDKTRTLIFQLENAYVRFTLSNEQDKEVIKLYISREYGKRMENNYQIINDTLYSDNSDDLVLIDNVYRTVQHMMGSFLIFWITIVVNHAIANYSMDPMNSYFEDYWDNDLEVKLYRGSEEFFREEYLIERLNHKSNVVVVKKEQVGKLSWSYNFKNEETEND